MARERDEDHAEQNTRFVVRDKRRFDSSGEERNSESSETIITGKTNDIKSDKFSNLGNSSTLNKESLNKDSSNRKKASNNGSNSLINFSSFIMSLGSQALLQLGVMAPPPGVEVEKDLNGAKNTIEILDLIEEKTVGNLDADEEQLLKGILHDLRLAFVRSSKG
jgi:hypothetical protein